MKQPNRSGPQRSGPKARADFTRFWTGLLPKAKGRSPLHRDAAPSAARWLANTQTGLMFSYVVLNDNESPNVELYINWPDREKNLRAFHELAVHKHAIEDTFGDKLAWLPREGDGVACRIAADVPGDFLNEQSWPKLQDDLIDAMLRLESAFAPFIKEYLPRDNL